MFPIYANILISPNFNEAFLVYPNLIEGIGPYPNAPNLPKCS